MLLLLLGLLTGCNHTPTYQGPPNLIVHVLMKKWAIVPDRIEVPQGAHVELVVTTEDVEHGIGVPGLDINEPVQPGRTTVVRFLAEKAGVYPMKCSVLCGRGHDRMKGEIVIAPVVRAEAGTGNAAPPRAQVGTYFRSNHPIRLAIRLTLKLRVGCLWWGWFCRVCLGCADWGKS